MNKGKSFRGIIFLLACVFLVSISLTACKKDYTVTFETNGGLTSDGNAIEPMVVKRNARLNQNDIPTPQKPDYVFTGWYKDSALRALWDFSGDKITKNTTLYAAYGEAVSQFTFIENQDKTSYSIKAVPASGSNSELVIPSHYRGLPVTAIAAEGFMSRYMTKLVIPSTIEKIGDKAFQNCYLLKTITFADGSRLSSIGEYSFTGTKVLESLRLPSSLTDIGNYSFSNGTLLHSVLFDEDSSLNTIGKNAFANCPKLSKIGVLSQDGLSATLPASLVKISEYAFQSDTSLANISFAPNCALTEIQQDAFYGTGLVSITLPKNLQTLGTYVFSECKSLKTVDFEAGAKLTEIPVGTFYRCLTLHTVILPESITTVSSAFSEANNLKKLELHSFVSASGGSLSGVFDTTKRAVAVIVPAEHLDTYKNANSSYKQYIVSLEDTALGRLAEGFLIESVTNEQGTKNSLLVYFGTAEAASVDAAWDISTIGAFAFSGSYTLKNLTVGGSFDVGKSAFENCPALSFANISGVKTLGDKAFYSSGITDIRLGDALTTVGPNVFDSCAKLTSIRLPASITKIESYAFRGCKALTKVEIAGSSTLEIANFAFYDNLALAEINLPASTVSIGNSAFSNCLALGSSTSVPFVLPSSLTQIEALAFRNCPSLKTITIPDSVVSIGNNAFRDCKGLEAVLISPSSQLKTVGESAFENCEKLYAITLPASLETVSSKAFFGCRYLKSINVNSVINEKEITDQQSQSQITVPELTQLLLFNNGNFTEGRVIIVEDTTVSQLFLDYKSAYDYYKDGEYKNNIFFVVSSDEVVSSDRLISQDGNTLLAYFGTDSALSLPYSVIGSYAVSYCPYLVHLTVTSTAGVISANAFEGLSALETVEFEYKAPQLGSYRIEKYAFRNCAKASAILRSVARVEEGAFYGWLSTGRIEIYESTEANWSSRWKEGCQAKISWL